MHTRRRHLRIILVLVTAVGIAFVAATSANAGGTCHQPPTEAATVTVELEALCFSPTVATIEQGSTVEFINRDDFGHNVVGHGASWGQFDTIAPAESLIVRFDTPGIHPFACTLHPGMVGAIVVADVTTSPAVETHDESGRWAAPAAAMAVAAGAAVLYLPRRSRRKVVTRVHP